MRVFPSTIVIKYLSFCKHTDISSGIGGIVILPISKDCTIEEGQIITDRVGQPYLGENVKIWQIISCVIQAFCILKRRF